MMNQFNDFLKSCIPNNSQVAQAMNYTLLQGGKRIRPRLLLALLQDYQVDYQLGFYAAAALEMIHTYSLIHDDLPAMDNDDYRRGVATNHKVYGEAIAILAGDGLLTQAFACLTSGPYSDSQKVRMIGYMADFAGENGMIYGQELDISHENKQLTFNELKVIHRYKTGKLFALSLVLAAVIADKNDDIDTLISLGYQIGLGFQIQDDIFDATKSFEQLGKYGSDEKNNKDNAVSVLGLDQAYKVMEECFEKCYNLIDSLKLPSHVKTIINEVKQRQF